MIKLHVPRSGKSEAIRAEAQRRANAGERIVLVSYDEGSRDIVYEDIKPEPQNMSDFKVGDVVRTAHGGYGRVASADPVLSAGGEYGLRVYVGRCRSETEATAIFYLNGLTLVSRPSEAQSAPALKVGDRVRTKRDGYRHQKGVPGKVISIYEGLGGTCAHLQAPDGNLFSELVGELELLPPEPAKPVPGEFQWLNNPNPPRPMTATEASIRGRNRLDPEYTHEMDAMRYLARGILDAAATREQAGARGVKVEDNNLVKSDGWMPAGTYMPLKEEPRAVKSEPGEMHFVRYKRLDAPPGYENLKRGIAKAIPAYERRFPSCTTQWANQGDDYELLEDAK